MALSSSAINHYRNILASAPEDEKEDLLESIKQAHSAEASRRELLNLDQLREFTAQRKYDALRDSRGPIGSVASKLAQGTMDLVEMTGRGLEVMDGTPEAADTDPGVLDKIGSGMANWATDQLENRKFLQPTKTEVDGSQGFIKRGVLGGIRSMPLTGGVAASAAAGATLGSVVPGVGTAVGGFVGAGAGLLGLFGLGSYGKSYSDTYNEVAASFPELSEPERRTKAHRVALTDALLETGTEAAGDLAAFLTFGGAKVFQSPIKETLKSLTRGSLKSYGKALLKDIPFEVGSEMIAGGGQAAVRKKEGLEGGSVTSGVLESIIPALTMSFGFGVGAYGLHQVQSRNLLNSINSDDARVRTKAAGEIAKRIATNTGDSSLASTWYQGATSAIKSGERFDLDETLIDFASTKMAEDIAAEQGTINVQPSPAPAAGAEPATASRTFTDPVASQPPDRSVAPDMNFAPTERTYTDPTASQLPDRSVVPDMSFSRPAEPKTGDYTAEQYELALSEENRARVLAQRAQLSKRIANLESIKHRTDTQEANFNKYRDQLSDLDAFAGDMEQGDETASQTEPQADGQDKRGTPDDSAIAIETPEAEPAAGDSASGSASIEIENVPEAPKKKELAVGDRVTWTGKGGVQMTGTIEKLGHSSHTVKTDEGKVFTPNIKKLARVDANPAASTEPSSQSEAGASSSPAPAVEEGTTGQLRAEVSEGDGGVTRVTYYDGDRKVGIGRIMGSTIGGVEVEEEFRRKGFGRQILDDLKAMGGRSLYAGSEEGAALAKSAGMVDRGNSRYSFKTVRRGKIGEKLAAGETVTTASGRETSAFPKVDTTTERKAQNTLKRVDAWLIGEAIAEAKRRGDDFNLQQFEAVGLNNITQTDKDSAEQYLFGEEQPPVIDSPLKPLTPTESTEPGNQSEANTETRTSGDRRRGGEHTGEERRSGEDRRQDAERRKRVDEMTPEEMQKELLTDYLTGLGNKRAYNEAEKKPVQVSIDADSLKWVNDNLGHSAGDELLKVIGAALNESGIEAYHPSGDEYWAQADTEEEVKAAMYAVDKYLQDNHITTEQPDGRVIQFNGGVSYGSASTLEEADRNLIAAKEERERAGLRAARGERPPGILETGPEGNESDNQQEGGGDQEVATAEEAPTQIPTELLNTNPKGYGESNKVFTKDAAVAARELLRVKLNQINTGLDPGMVQAGIQLAGYHIEAGARKFADYAKAMIEDIGEVVRPYLRSWYEAVRHYPGFDNKGMSSAEEIDQLTVDSENGKIEEKTSNESEVENVQSESQSHEGVAEGEQSGSLQGTEESRGTGRVLPEKGRPGRRASGKHGKDGDAGLRGRGNSQSTNVRLIPATKDYHITPEDQLGKGGQKQKFKNNVAAIRLLAELETRKPTTEDQKVLAKYVGWGGIPQAFYRPDGSVANGWENEARELKGLLSPEEYAAARASTQDAHYTSETVINAMYDGLKRLGFAGGSILEPSVGTGNFLGLMPRALHGRSKITGVELDNITSKIAQYLYPQQNIVQSGFQDFDIIEGSFDAIIGNPPFGSKTLFDAKNKDLRKFSIHNFFFAKSIKALRPGGVLAMVVSNSMMDKIGSTQREWMAKHTALLGAIRLPNDAFKVNAGTEVTTDIIFLRKLGDGEKNTGPAWTKVKDVKWFDDVTYRINEYFANNPEMMLGELTTNKLQPTEIVDGYYDAVPGLKATFKDGEKWSDDLLNDAVAKLPQGVYQAGQRIEDIENPEIIVSDPGFIKPFGHGLDDTGNAVHRLPDMNGKAVYEPVLYSGKPLEGKRLERFKGLMEVRDAVRRLFREEIADNSEKQMELYRKALNRKYDAFVKKFGYINQLANAQTLKGDQIDLPLLKALENDFETGVSRTVAKATGGKEIKPSAEKASVFTKRSRYPYRPATEAKTAKDALVIVLREDGFVNMPRIEALLGKTEGILEELDGIVFVNPATGGHETSDQYLSGNVKKKLKEAQAAGYEYAKNVEALKKVLPEDVPPENVMVRIGATWVPTDIYEDFAREVLGTPVGVRYNEAVGVWKIDVERGVASTYSTSRMTAGDIFSAMLRSKDIMVYDRDADGSRHFNKEETMIAKAKSEEIDRAFNDWWLEEQSRRDRMTQIFNDKVNTTIEGKHDGSHMIFPGMGVINPNVPRDEQLRVHQRNVVWRAIQKGKALFDHVVGSGKTFAAIATGMEMKRMGLLKKPMYVVPNHLVEQWAHDFQKLYPGSNVLAISKKDFSKQNRQEFMGRIATGDWDAVLLAHSSYGFIPAPIDYEMRFYQEQIDDYEIAIRELAEAEGKKSRSVKQMENTRDRLKEKLKALQDSPRDNVVDFAELGVDAIFVDEAHEFKNLFYATSRTRVAGLGNPTGAKKAFDMFVKARYILEKNNDKGVFFLTGTPVSNSISEMYTMMRYLEYDRLKEMGIRHFDQWSNMFASAISDWEVDPTGTRYRLQTKMDFVNIPGLISFYKDFADVITTNNLREWAAESGKIWPIPDVKGGKPENVVVERSDLQKSFMEWIVHRFDNMPKDPKEDNPLKATGEAMKAALDMRLIDHTLPDDPGSKVNEAVRRVKSIYDENTYRKGTQLVFCDLSVPKNAKSKLRDEIQELRAEIKKAEAAMAEGEMDGDDYIKLLDKMAKYSPAEILAVDGGDFSVYDDMKEKFIREGVPAGEIAFIHDANTDKQKEELFAKVRNGAVRILIGSTSKMGAGMNVQNKLVALHHLDAPWRPSDLEQREGRIIRQGNEFFDDLYEKTGKRFEVGIYRYATKETLDTRRWQVIERKAKNIEQLRVGGQKWGDKIEDAVEAATNAAEMKAAASGNPLILEEIQIRKDIEKIEALKRGWQSKRFANERTISHAEALEHNYPDHVEGIEADRKLLEANPAPERKDWAVTFDGTTYKPEGWRWVPAEIESDDPKAVKQNKAEIKTTQELNQKAYKKAAEGLAKALTRWMKKNKLKEGSGTELHYRGVHFDVDVNGGRVFITPDLETVDIETRNIVFWSEDEISPEGLPVRLDNILNRALSGLDPLKDSLDNELARVKRNADIARKSLEEQFGEDEKIEDLRKRHQEVLKKLQKDKDQQKDAEPKDFSMWTGRIQAIEVQEKTAAPKKKAQFYIHDHDEGFIPAPKNAKKVEVFDGIDTFVAREGKNSPWTLTEASTGLAMASGKIQAEAIEEAKKRVDSAGGIEAVKEQIADVLKDKDKISPWVAESQGPAYNARKGSTPGPSVDVAAIQKTFKGQAVGTSPDGSVWVRFKGGGGVRISAVDNIEAAGNSFEIAYGRMREDGELITGKYERGAIELQRDISDRFDLSHESYHHLERSGMLNRADIDAINRAIRKKTGKAKPTEEDRAKWVENNLRHREAQPPGFRKVLQKIADIIDAILNAFGFRTAQGVIREMETGEIYSRSETKEANEARSFNTTRTMEEYQRDGMSLLERAKKAHGFGVTDNDLRWWNKVFEVPYSLSKKFPESMGRHLDVEIRSAEKRSEMLEKDYAEGLGDVQSTFKGDKQALKALQALIWKWDGERFPKKSVPTDWYTEEADGGISINPEHYTEVRAFLKKEGVSKKVIDGFVAIRQKLDEKWTDAFYTMKAEGLDPDLIEEYRGKINKINNYFPHRRAGNISLSIIDKEDGKAVYTKHYYNGTGKLFSKINEHQAKSAEKWLRGQLSSGSLPGNLSRYEISKPRKLTRLPQEAFFGINMKGMQQVLGLAGSNLSQSRVEYEADRLYNKEAAGNREEALNLARKRLTADMEAAISKAVADVFKAQGWGSHAIHRKGTPGFIEDDIFGTLFEYLSGYAGFKTKMVRAREHSKILTEINAKKNPGEYQYAARYVKDMLENQTLTDRVVDTVRGAFFVKYLGFVVKSGIVNLTQNVVMAGPVLSMHTKNSHTKLTKAMLDTRRALTSRGAWTGKGIDYPGLSKDEQAALHELTEKGVTQDQYLRELKGDIPGVGKGRIFKKVINTSGIFMQLAERFNRASTGLAAYRVGIKDKGMTHGEAVEFAKGIVYDAHFLYGKHNLPEMARGTSKALRAAYTFRSFTHNYLCTMAHMLMNQGSAGRKAAARSLVNIVALGGLTSMPFFSALSSAFMAAIGADDDDDALTKAREMMPTPFTRDLVSHGLIGAVLGADITGSISIEFPQSWSDIVGVPYSVGEDVYNSIKSLRSGQAYRALSETPLTPMSIKNAMRGIELATTGQRNRSGRDINYPGEEGPLKISEGDAFMKLALGLQPLSVSKGYKAYQASQKLQDSISEKKTQWADRFVNAYRRNDRKEMLKVEKEIRAWNQKARREKATYKIVNVKAMIKSRLRTDNLISVPKAMRGRVMEIGAMWQ